MGLKKKIVPQLSSKKTPKKTPKKDIKESSVSDEKSTVVSKSPAGAVAESPAVAVAESSAIAVAESSAVDVEKSPAAAKSPPAPRSPCTILRMSKGGIPKLPLLTLREIPKSPSAVISKSPSGAISKSPLDGPPKTPSDTGSRPPKKSPLASMFSKFTLKSPAKSPAKTPKTPLKSPVIDEVQEEVSEESTTEDTLKKEITECEEKIKKDEFREAQRKATSLYRSWIDTEISDILLKKLGADKLVVNELKSIEYPICTPSFVQTFPFMITYRTKVGKYHKSESKADDGHVVKIPYANYKISKKAFVAKVMPPSNTSFLRTTSNIYKKDAFVTEFVLGDLNSILGLNNLQKLKYQELVHYNVREYGKELLILEDIRSEGFKKHNYEISMNYLQASAVMKAYARLHAGSKLLKHHGYPADMISPELKENEPQEGSMQYDSMKKAIEGILQSNAMLINKLPSYEKCHEWILTKIKTAMVDFNQIYKSQESDNFRVLSHCATGGNSLYFREKGANVEVCLCDFSCSKMLSVAVDINNFLFTCLDSDDRKGMKQNLVYDYFFAFKTILQKEGRPIPFNLEELNTELSKKVLTGWYSVMNSLPTLMGARKCSTIELINNNDLTDFIRDYKIAVTLLFQSTPIFKKRILDMYDDLMVCNAIPN